MIKKPTLKAKRESAKKSNICLVIPTFNQYNITKDTINKLKEQTIEFDIVIVDNASNDNTYENFIKEFSDITLLLATENYGGAGGLFLGEKYAYDKQYEYIILSDNDAIPIDNDLIESIVDLSDKNTIVDFINDADEYNPSLKIFHYGCYHREIITKIGFIDYKLFIYGDDVEYSLRLESNQIKRTFVEKRYWHPMKYHYPSNRIYFDIRNELENAKNYKTRRIHTLNTLFSKFLFFLFFEKTKLRIYLYALKDWLLNRWDNSYIEQNLKSDIEYSSLPIASFNKLIKEESKKIFVVNHKRIVEILTCKYEKYKLRKIFRICNQIIIQNVYTYPSLVAKKFLYIVSIDDKNVVFFEKQNNVITNVLILIVIVPFLLLFLFFVFCAIYLKKKDNIKVFRNREYLEQISTKNEIPKNHNTCIVILAFNQLEMVKKISKYYINQLEYVDILFVDNDSSDGTYKYLCEHYAGKFNILKTNKNYGGAGGFSIGQEWVIARNYEYCILTEEDALPLNDDLVYEMVSNQKANKIIKTKFYEMMTNSFTLHFTSYPVEIFKRIGVMNSKLFFRADDWEYGKRIESLIHNGEYQEKIVEKYYSHPILKKGFGIGTNYFNIRNGLYVYLQFPKQNSFIDVSKIFFKDILFCLFAFFYDKNMIPLLQFKDAFIDFLFDDLSKNEILLSKFKGKELKPNQNIEIKKYTFEEFFSYYQKYFIVTSMIRKNVHFKKFFQNSKKKYSNLISSKYNGVNRIFAMFGKHIVFVEEIDFLNKNITCFEFENNRILSISLLAVSAFCAIILYVIIFPLILLKIAIKCLK
jgi:GT2 family glycosyltransferase